MKTMLISDFKAHCISVLNEVCRSGEAIQISRRGEPLVRVEAVKAPSKKRELGNNQGRMKINCDLILADSTIDWDMEK